MFKMIDNYLAEFSPTTILAADYHPADLTTTPPTNPYVVVSIENDVIISGNYYVLNSPTIINMGKFGLGGDLDAFQINSYRSVKKVIPATYNHLATVTFSSTCTLPDKLVSPLNYTAATIGHDTFCPNKITALQSKHTRDMVILKQSASHQQLPTADQDTAEKALEAIQLQEIVDLKKLLNMP